MPKRKSKFPKEPQQKYPFFRKDEMSWKQNALLVATELLFLQQIKANFA